MIASARRKAVDEASALEELHEMACTDGLPVVIPTEDRVERMILASLLDGDLVLGEMGPALGACTVEKLAIAAVMAGCTPDHIPVVLAATRAILDTEFDLTEMQATTHDTAPFILVNGPARSWCGGIASGYGALGPGHRANASIGRALRLAMINIGGGRPGTSDMALLGHPGKFTYCLAEAEEESPFPPFHVARGFNADQSAVTVMGGEAPHSVIGVLEQGDAESADRFLNSLAGAFANAATNNAALSGGAAMVLLNPSHASVLASVGLTRESVAQAIFERAENSAEDLARTGASGIGKVRDRVRCFKSSDDVLIAVAGGGGLYSVAIPTWCAGPHRNRAVTVAIDLDQACEVPGAN